ncbi:amidohydrolase family protein [Dinoroseobacter sp. PD6]|uniref:amidohydrolase family protein n=1 Tax=Dinoroseobacter sp. PD6 TaxID=3028384 RepID=UPI00237B24C3|nr:amidohydrolase family protein [Dinoroseobacter sp. PD6]MDD9717557.1 amidohydrolase family protein [Dinoroseobacter sp. PD6]
MTQACLAHLQDPSPPKRPLPPGATDCHSHVIVPEADHPFVANRSYTPPPATLAQYKALHARLGIERAVIVQPSVYGTDNSVTLEAIAGYGPGCRGIAVVDADVSMQDLQAMNAAGIRGARINMLFSGGIGLDDLEPLARRIADLDWHFQLLIDGPTLADLEARLANLPVPVVIDHMGHMQTHDGLDQPGFRALRRLVVRGNTWVKLSGNYRMSSQRPRFEDVVPFAQALISDNSEHMVWGTDWPHPAMLDFMPDDGSLVDALDAYVTSQDQKQRILVDNPATLYGF